MDDDDDADDIYGAVAQPVAQLVVSEKVAGSNPVRSALGRWSSLVQDAGLSRRRSRVRTPYAPPSQIRSSVGEHLFHTQGVGGSIPPGSTIQPRSSEGEHRPDSTGVVGSSPTEATEKFNSERSTP